MTLGRTPSNILTNNQLQVDGQYYGDAYRDWSNKILSANLAWEDLTNQIEGNTIRKKMSAVVFQ